MRHVILLVLMTVAGSTEAAEPVHFADANLKAAVEQRLAIKNPTPMEMRSLRSLTASGEIVDLENFGISILATTRSRI